MGVTGQKTSTVVAALMACSLALDVYAGAPSRNEDAPPALDTTQTREALQLRGSELDNFIYEIAPPESGNAAPETTERLFHKRALWIAAGGAGLVVLAGTVYLLLASDGGEKQVYLDYSDAGN
jgi:hypothetical protein